MKLENMTYESFIIFWYDYQYQSINEVPASWWKLTLKNVFQDSGKRRERRAETKNAGEEAQRSRGGRKKRERGSQISGESVVSDYDKSHLGLKKEGFLIKTLTWHHTYSVVPFSSFGLRGSFRDPSIDFILLFLSRAEGRSKKSQSSGKKSKKAGEGEKDCERNKQGKGRKGGGQ